jgi:hypothetical protein
MVGVETQRMQLTIVDRNKSVGAIVLQHNYESTLSRGTVDTLAQMMLEGSILCL